MAKFSQTIPWIFLAAVLFSGNALAQDPTDLFWTLPTTNEDGTPLTDLRGTAIHCGPASRQYDRVEIIDDPTANTVSIKQVTQRRGVNYCAATVFNDSGRHSVLSNEVSFTLTAVVDLLMLTGGEVTSRNMVLISDTEPVNYIWFKLAAGERVYIDRTYTYIAVGAYADLSALRTANNDKITLESITFRVSAPVTVYVLWDSRLPLPSWMVGWADTDDDVTTTDVSLRAYRKDFDSGIIILGGTETVVATSSMYTVVVEER